MGGFTRFSCRWDFARFLPHMYSLIYNEGWCHSILLLKSNLKTLFKVHLSLFWCSQVVCLIPPEAGEIVLEMFFSQHSWSALCLSYAYKHSSLIAYSVSLESLSPNNLSPFLIMIWQNDSSCHTSANNPLYHLLLFQAIDLIEIT